MYLVASTTTSFSLAKRAESWSETDRNIVKFEGAKFVELPDEVGVASEQLTAQQRPAAFDIAVLFLFFALSQHFIIFP